MRMLFRGVVKGTWETSVHKVYKMLISAVLGTREIYVWKVAFSFNYSKTKTKACQSDSMHNLSKI